MSILLDSSSANRRAIRCRFEGRCAVSCEGDDRRSFMFRIYAQPNEAAFNRFINKDLNPLPGKPRKRAITVRRLVEL